MLNVVDEFTRECLAIRVGRKLGSADVIDVLADLFITRGTPGFIRSDNDGEFTAVAVKNWISGVRASTAYIEPGTLRWHSSRCAAGTLASSARGRTATWKASTASSGTSCSTEGCSTTWLKRRC